MSELDDAGREVFGSLARLELSRVGHSSPKLKRAHSSGRNPRVNDELTVCRSSSGSIVLNRAIATRIFVTERTVEAHVTQIFQKLELPQSADQHRRVLAVLAFLRA